MADEPKTRRSGLDALSAVAFGTAGLALVLVTLVQAWQVYARYVLNDSPSWTEPVSLLLIGVAAMFGAAEGVRRETHFGFFTLRDASPASLRAPLKALSRVFALAVGLGLLFGAGVLVVDNWDVPMAGAPLPLGLRFLPFAIGGGLMTVFALERLLRGDPDAPADAEPAPEA